jgi:hypothetical protein
LKSGETDSFFLKDSKENHEYVESAKLLLPVWIEATCGKDRIELVLIQILDDFFEPSFEMRILKKPR